MQQLILGPALFYDLPEYLNIVSSHPFFQVFSLGHFPIHPVFVAILWLLTRGPLVKAPIPINVIAMVFGIISIFVFNKISKLIFKNGHFWLATIIFTLFPAVWLINTNLMVESVTLTLYLAGLYFFLTKKAMQFFISLFLMTGTHLQSIFWIPALFLAPYIFEVNFKKEDVIKFIKIALAGISMSIVFYILLYYCSGRIPGGTTEQLSTYLSSGILRMIRNIWLSFIRNFGTLTPFVLALVLIRKIKSKKVLIAWIMFLVLVATIGANWQGVFMGRRIIFSGVILALGLYKYLQKWSVFFILYLLPIVAANVILYSNSSPFITPNIPKGQVLIETHYLKPFTKYNGTILWIGESDLGVIDNYLKNGTRVFLTEQAITAPYLLLVGQNYHITSLGRVGDSESRFLFKNYTVEQYNDSFELKMFNGVVSGEAGSPVIYYDQSFWGRLARRRIDYGDIGTWLWAITVNHRDPIGWIYKDARGMVAY